MTQDENELLKLLFPSGYPDEWNSSSTFSDYISKLGSYNVDELVKEPNKLKEEQTATSEHTQELAVSNYKTFIQTSQCSKDLFNRFNTIELDLFKLLENIPTFEQKCQTFAVETNGINTLRKLNSLTLTRNAQLLEILELPQLMDSFIKDGLYENALELASYVRRLYTKHSDIPIFKSIVNDVEKSWLVMLHQLLSQLRSDLTLPKSLQIVGYLRRMEIFTETELRLKFLQARDTWFQNCLTVISNEDTTYHLNKTIEITRVNLFIIVTQYRAIFNDDEHSPLSEARNTNMNQNIIFFGWIRNKITEFLTILENDLQKGVSSIDSILGQCMFFGLSFSKVGCDFRPLMVKIFTKVISKHFQQSISNATKNFEKNMEKFTLINKNHPSVPWRMKSTDPIQPPDSLIEFYPLADYLNHILTSFNELRLCPPITIVCDVVDSLEKSLLTVCKAIVTLYAQERQAFNSNSKDAFARLCISFADDLVPYLQKCIHIIFPPNIITAHLGLNVQQLQKENISFLNKVKIIEPIKHLLPAKIEPVLSETPLMDPIKDNDTSEIIFNDGEEVKGEE
ncbi:conserved oligomeric golgi complex component 8 [Holotrichia oblita]|uniref:Conserved oligomeric golgi complex component 8 n=2 Tax=Holotrichia oblita TaxID=644536 RepID=A0ACB9T7I4_HOLOL|nr:conserved oligomeric golgi complex component 8 [Holotrichia oblita]